MIVKPDRISGPASESPFADSASGWRILAIVRRLPRVGGSVATSSRELGRYERDAIENGEYWRLVSGHLVHLGFGHLWPNLAALVVIGALFEGVFRNGDWWRASIASAAAIDLGLYVLDPDRGLVRRACPACCTGSSPRARWRCCFVETCSAPSLASASAAKLLFEQIVGPVPFTAASVGGPVVVAAHLYGAAGGIAGRNGGVHVRAAAYASIIPRLVDSGEVLWISSALPKLPGIAGRTALVTGASRGIGRAIAETLAQPRRRRRRHGHERAGCCARSRVGSALGRRLVAAPSSTSAATHRSRRCSRASTTAPGDRRQQRRHHSRQSADAHEARRVERRRLDESVVALSSVQGELARNDEGALRAHHQHQLRRRPDGECRANELCRGESRHDRLHESRSRARSRRATSPSTSSRRVSSIPT